MANQEITATLFDGTVLTFPEDTPQEVVNRVAKEQTERLQGGILSVPSDLTPAQQKEEAAIEEATAAERASERIFEKDSFMGGIETSLKDAGKVFSKVAGERFGIDPENLPEFKRYMGSLTGVADLGAGAVEAVGGGIGAGISLAADLIGAMGVSESDRIKKDLLALALETPIPFAGVTQIGRLPSISAATKTLKKAPRREVGQAAPLEGEILQPELPRIQAPTLERAGQRAGETFTRINEKIDRVFPPSETAQSTLRDMLKLDKIEPTNIRRITKDFEARNGRTPTLLEIGGENVEALARKAGGEIGEGRTVIENFRNNVLENQTRMVKDIAERTLVTPNRNFLDDVNALEMQMKRQAQPLYDEAYKQTVSINDDIRSMVNTPAGKTALRKAEKILKQEGKNPADLGIEKGKISDTASVEALDAIKRGFDDIIESSRDKTTGKLVLDQYGRATNKTRAEFRNAVDELSHVYKEARDAFAGPATLKNALIDARNAAKKPSVSAEQIAARMKDMTASEKEFYRSGFMRGIMDIMEGGVTDVNRVRKLVRSESLVNKLEVIFDNKEMAQQFVNQLREAEKLSKRAQMVSPSTGSQTALRQADIGSIGAMQSKSDVLRNAVKAGYDRLRQNRNIRNEQLVNKDIAELLTQPLTDDILEKIAARLQE